MMKKGMMKMMMMRRMRMRMKRMEREFGSFWGVLLSLSLLFLWVWDYSSF